MDPLMAFLCRDPFLIILAFSLYMKQTPHLVVYKEKIFMSKIFWFVLVIFVCLVALLLITNNEKKTPLFIDYENQPFIGDASAPVSIVEFGDYKCIHCSEFNRSVIPYIIENFVINGQAKLYFINYAFLSNDSTLAALYAEAVYHELGNEIFWEFHELLFEHHADVSNNILNEEALESMLAEVATESQVEQVRSTYNDGVAQEALDHDMSIARNLRVNSTPTIFINGIKFEGKTMDDFSKRIQEAENEQ